MKQGTPLKRTGMKRSQLRRCWEDARAKIDGAVRCRLADLGGCSGPLEAAHTIGREHDIPMAVATARIWVSNPDRYDLYVEPDSVIPLCKAHHKSYDDHAVDVLQTLAFDEQMDALKNARTLQAALRRTAPLIYRDTFRGEAVGGANSQESASQYQGEAT